MINSEMIESFNKRKILLIGDSILDVYIYGDIVSQALYAPIPEVEERRSNISFGGNGLIASHILELGGQVYFISILGADEEARRYDSFKHPNLKKFFLVDKTRRTTVKRRWYADNRALLQANQVDNHDINPELESKVVKIIEKNINKIDIIVIMDPQHGMMTKGLISKILRLSKKYRKPVYVDAQVSHRPSNHHLYQGVDTFFLNAGEAKAVCPKFNTVKLKQSLQIIANKLRANNIIVKLGEKGSIAFWSGQFFKNIPPRVKAIDVCGAGDAFLAAFCLGDRNKPHDCLEIANIWGALATTIHGTLPPKKEGLLKFVRSL